MATAAPASSSFHGFHGMLVPMSAERPFDSFRKRHRTGPPGLAQLRGILWLAFFGLLLNGNWEWLQTPFYDDGGASVNTIVWYRLHCTLADVVILLACAAVVSAAARGTGWLRRPDARQLVALSLLGTAYTALSEQVNVALRESWAYSSLMPVVPGTEVGLVPVLQWLMLPAAAVWLASRVR